MNRTVKCVEDAQQITYYSMFRHSISVSCMEKESYLLVSLSVDNEILRYLARDVLINRHPFVKVYQRAC